MFFFTLKKVQQYDAGQCCVVKSVWGKWAEVVDTIISNCPSSLIATNPCFAYQVRTIVL